MGKRKKRKYGAVWLIVIVILLAGFGTFQIFKGKLEPGLETAGVQKEAAAPYSGKSRTSVAKTDEKQLHESNTASGNAANAEKNGNQAMPMGGQTVEAKADALIKQMSLKEKIGQMMMVGFYGYEEDNHIINMISKQNVGGVILFDRNMKSPGQVAELTNKLKQNAENQHLSIPLMIGLDQEGGPVLRMRDQVSPIPSEQKLGKTASAEDVHNIAEVNGEEMASMGIQVDFAPVLDLSDHDERSFGSDPVKGFHYGLAEVQGLNATNVAATIKHFPGNGRVVVDPHLDQSIVKADKTTLENVDMAPFRQMIEKQKENQFFVMVTHVKYPAFDSQYPASISKKIIQNLLRDHLGYQGIVVTDDLDMGAVSKYYSYDQLGSMAINAGADILLVCHDYNHQQELYDGILRAVQTGKISEERINQSVKRILTYKLAHLTNQPVSAATADKIVGSSGHLQMIAKLN